MILTIANQKGGTAKTTTAAAIAQGAAHRGRKVLVIDLDPQGNLTLFAGANAQHAGAFELMAGSAPACDCIQHTAAGNLDVIAASWNLSTISSSTGSAYRLHNALRPLQNVGLYDLIVIDTPPTAGELQYNALIASTRLLIPLKPDTGSLQGLYQIADTAARIQQTNNALQIAGYLLTCCGRSTLHRQLAAQIEEAASARGIPYCGSIRQGVAVQEAQTLQRSLYDYAPNSKPAQDYLTVLDALHL